MSQSLNSAVAVIGIDIGKNSFHILGLDERGAIALRQKWSRGQVEARLANMPTTLSPELSFPRTLVLLIQHHRCIDSGRRKFA